MVRSMFAAVAGLKAHQSKMDVISNNIANANTTGYKSQSATFKDSIYSSLTKPSGFPVGVWIGIRSRENEFYSELSQLYRIQLGCILRWPGVLYGRPF